MFSRWSSALPPNLSGEDPNVLIPLLGFAMSEEGISQSDLRRKIGINQPRLSKLLKKLVKQRWIRVKKSESDGRVMLVTTAAIARDLLGSLETELAALQPTRPSTSVRGKWVRPVPGQGSFDLQV